MWTAAPKPTPITPTRIEVERNPPVAVSRVDTIDLLPSHVLTGLTLSQCYQQHTGGYRHERNVNCWRALARADCLFDVGAHHLHDLGSDLDPVDINRVR